MGRILCALALASTVLLTGCYVATVDMGKPASETVHRKTSHRVGCSAWSRRRR
jgi:hypothetical protein